MPAAVRPAILLTHWGRTDFPHVSGTGYGMDNYTFDFKHPQWEPVGSQQKIAGFPCYDPAKARPGRGALTEEAGLGKPSPWAWGGACLTTPASLATQ